jgi:hypothetical protein
LLFRLLDPDSLLYVNLAYDTMFGVNRGLRVAAEWSNADRPQCLLEICKAALRIERPGRAPATPESPAHAFECKLPVVVLRPAFRPMVLVPVKLDGEAPVLCALNHEIDPVIAGPDLRPHTPSALGQSAVDFALESRLAEGQRVLGLDRGALHRILEVTDDLGLKVIRLKHRLVN